MKFISPFVSSKNLHIFALRFSNRNIIEEMSRVCQITGKRALTGNRVSHSNIKTKRRFNINLQTKKFYIPEEDKWITLKVSTDGMRRINKKGISTCLKEAREKGYLV